MLAFEEEENLSPAIIKVVGVGGAGMNAIERMVSMKLEGVELIAMNTDEQVLRRSSAHVKVNLGTKVTRGMGAGGRPEVGAQAAQEDRDKILNALKGADMVFITAGMGGGTGTGASPVVAEVAREIKALTVGVVSLPFKAEGQIKMQFAREGQAKLKEKVDALISIPNDALFKVIDRNTPLKMAYKAIDDVLARSVIGISNIINNTGYVNVDFKDVLTIMRDNGDAIIGVGEGAGESRVSDALQNAIHHPLLEGKSIDGAQMVLINVVGGSDLTLYEYNEIQETIREQAARDAHIIVGFYEDPNLEERVAITVIATGYRDEKASLSMQSPSPSYEKPAFMHESKTSAAKLDLQREDPNIIPFPGQPQGSSSEVRPEASGKGQPGLQFPDLDSGMDNFEIPAIFRRK